MQRTCIPIKAPCIITALFSLIMVAQLPASAQQTDWQEPVKQVLQKQTEAWNRGDINSFMQTYWKNDSLCFVGGKDITYGWENALSRYQKAYPDPEAMGKLNFTLQQIKLLSPAYCFVIGHWHLTRKAGNLEGEFTLLLKRINGQWKIITDHSS